MENIKLIAAKNHPSEYMIHKYWARKPHNVISHFLSGLVPIGGTVIDPFCGSGVTLREASKLGFNSFGFDINPVSILISNVTNSKIDVEEFYLQVKKILDDLSFYNELFTYKNKKIKYLVHETVVECNYCKSKIAAGETKKDGRKYKCPVCDSTLRFNLEKLVSTTVTSIVLEGGEVIDGTEEMSMQLEKSNINLKIDTKKYNHKFKENRRILAFEGMETSQLFTPRNFAVLCEVANRFHEIENEEIKRAALMMLTASVAQCSRLIPFRNNMTTGGPAWSVPGFWVPPQHLETNPISHLNARLIKVKRGLDAIAENPGKASVIIEKNDAAKGMKNLRGNGIAADLIFFDPPYGDSVPYTEFSLMWNSFLKDIPDVNHDISVSDRLPKNDSWNNYQITMEEILSEVAATLKPQGKLLITFNNHELRAWEVLLKSLQINKFECNFVTYQIPAVISAKAQFSPENSYNSDIYSVYSVNPNLEISRSLSPVIEALKKCASSRDGIITKNLALRVIIITWMKNNISVDLLHERDNLISGLFIEEDGKLIWKTDLDSKTLKLEEISKDIAKKILKNGPCDWSELYEKIASEAIDIGIPDPGELRLLLNDSVIFDKKRCLAFFSNHIESEQLEFPIEISH